VVGNVLIHGADTKKGLPLIQSPGDLYEADNLAFDPKGNPAPIMGERTNRLNAKPVWPGGLNALPADKVEEDILKNAGARPWDRDAVDTRILEDFRNRRGRIIDSQEQVGGYPRHEPTRRVLDVPDSGRREWLAELGESGG
jgi:hypothetical protein